MRGSRAPCASSTSRTGQRSTGLAAWGSCGRRLVLRRASTPTRQVSSPTRWTRSRTPSAVRFQARRACVRWARSGSTTTTTSRRRSSSRRWFRRQVGLARDESWPVVIHTREADDDTVRILQEESEGTVRGVFHCFTGDTKLARQALDLGFHVSFSGIVTFPRAEAIRAAAKLVPFDRLLAETDAPYLAPTPYRGKRNGAGVGCPCRRDSGRSPTAIGRSGDRRYRGGVRVAVWSGRTQTQHQRCF